MSSALNDKTCPVCLDEYVMPEREQRMLPCLHSACSSCIQDMLKTATEKNEATLCVTCYEPFKAAEVAACLPSAAVRDCVPHGNKEFTLFCDNCKKMVCDLCAQEKTHEGHTIMPQKEGIQKAVNTLKEQVEKLTDRLPRIEAAKAELVALNEALKKRIETLTGEINAAFGGLVTELNARPDRDSTIVKNRIIEFEQRRDTLITEVHTQIKADQKEVEIQLQTLEINKSHINAAQYQTEALAKLVNSS